MEPVTSCCCYSPCVTSVITGHFHGKGETWFCGSSDEVVMVIDSFHSVALSLPLPECLLYAKECYCQLKNEQIKKMNK